MADIPEPDTRHDETPLPQDNDEPQCRICLDGEDPELGRLIRPCLCKGSVSYVHVKCLQRWRTTSSSQSAFYKCQQCGYNYRFARTMALGIASNTIVVGVLSCIAFTFLLFFSSFITTWLLSGTGEDSYFIVYPWEIFRDVVRTAVCVLTDTECADTRYGYGYSSAPSRKPRFSTPKGPPTLLGRFVRRLLLGLPTVGAGSLINLIWSLPFPISTWVRATLRRRNRSASDISTLIFVTFVLIGAARALYKVYQLTERAVRRGLLHAEDAILEVS